VSIDELRRFGIAAAMAAGHSPQQARQWTDGDLLHFAEFTLARPFAGLPDS
jgi:hypothetical protein